MRIGIDVGGTNIQAALVRGGAIVARAHAATEPGRGTDGVLDAIAEAARRACAAGGADLGRIEAIGVATAGAIDMPRGVVIEAPNLGWHDLPLRDLLAARTGRPVIVDNDVNGAMWGEWVHGGLGPDALGVWVGTGVGGGLVLGGRLHYGSRFTAGEIGNTVVYPDGPRGERTLEDHCGRAALARRLAARRPAGAPPLDAAALAEGWRNDDAIVTPALRHAAHLLGVAIANAVTLLAVQSVVVGGGTTEALGEPWLEIVRASFRDAVFPARHGSCPIVMTRLRGDAALLGAAALAVQA